MLHTTSKPYRGYRTSLCETNQPEDELGLLSAVLIGLQTKVTNIIYNKLISTTP